MTVKDMGQPVRQESLWQQENSWAEIVSSRTASAATIKRKAKTQSVRLSGTRNQKKRQAGRRQTVGEKKLINLKGWSQSPAQQSNGRLRGETYLQEQIYIQN